MKVVPVALAVPVLPVEVAVNREGSQSDGALFRVLGAGAFPVFVESRGVVVGLVVVVVVVEVSNVMVLCVVQVQVVPVCFPRVCVGLDVVLVRFAVPLF